MIEQVDFLLRTVTIGAALMLIAQLSAGELRETIKYPLVATIIGAIAYLIQSSAMLLTEGPLRPWVELIAIATPFWIWLFGYQMFAREPQRRIALAALAVLLIGWVLHNFVPIAAAAGFYLLHAVALVLIGDLVRVGALARRDSPAGEVNSVGEWLPLIAGALTGAILLFEIFTGGVGRYPVASLVIAVLILLVMLFAGLVLMRADLQLRPAAEPRDNDNTTPAPVSEDQ